MIELDILFRGGFVALAIFLIVHCVRARLTLPFALACIAFAIAKISYILVSAPPLGDLVGPASPVLIAIARISPALLWWFAMSLFDEGRSTGLLIGLIVYFSLSPYVIPDSLNNLAHNFVVIPLMAHIIYVAITGYRGDLIAPRRRFRVVFAVVVPIVGIVTGITEIVLPLAENEISIRLLQSGTYLFLALWFLAWITDLDRDLLLSSRPRGQIYDDPEQQKEMLRLQGLLNSDIHRTEGLSIGSLAEAMEIPEHRLRRLINQHMGYRNISELINDRRIDDAKDKLSDPTLSSRQITQIAFDVGYGSLAPFNRAFRERTGQSPKEFRRASLGTPDRDLDPSAVQG